MNTAVGTALPRVDGPDKVTGRARYGADHGFGHVAHALLVTAPVARGRILHIGARGACTRSRRRAARAHARERGVARAARGQRGAQGPTEIDHRSASYVNRDLANAVFNATGVRVRELPIRLDDLLAHMPPP
jgi:hypothetical protein